jgi:hypothetical protein
LYPKNRFMTIVQSAAKLDHGKEYHSDRVRVQPTGVNIATASANERSFTRTYLDCPSFIDSANYSRRIV